MSSFAKVGALLALAGTLAGCSPQKQPLEASPPVPSKGYTEIDLNTYFIEGYSHKADSRLPQNLSKFRSEVSGDFILVLDDSRSSLTDDALALRVVATNAVATNRIVGVFGGSGGTK